MNQLPQMKHLLKNKKIINGKIRALAGICSISFLLLLVLILNTKTAGLTGQLSDVNQSSYEGQAAFYLQKRGVISGFPDGTFRGDNPVNRVEAAKMLLLAGNYTLSRLDNTDSWPDIQPGAWYEQFALNAVAKDIIAGYPDGTFGPSRTVIRAEFLKMLANTFKMETDLPYHYTDVPPNAWYSTYAGMAEKYNLFLYDESALLPSAPMSREEVAWAIYQMFMQRSYNLVIRTPFDYVATSDPRLPNQTETETMHGAAPENPSASSSSVFSNLTNTSSQSAAAYCQDSDGFDINTRGTAVNLLMTQNNSFTDTCKGNNILFEYYCNENGYLTGEDVNCSVSCVNGACSGETTDEAEEIDPRRPTGTLKVSSSSSSSYPDPDFYESPIEKEVFTGCNDTDSTHRFTDGNNIYARGTTNGQSGNNVADETDTCQNSSMLREFYCAPDNQIQSEDVTCELGCEDGACVSPGTDGTCMDMDADPEYANGRNFNVKSRIFVIHPEEGNFTGEDYCESPALLNEYVCARDGRVGLYKEACDCLDGACVDNP